MKNPKAKRQVSKPRNRKQRAVVTFTDIENGRIKLTMDFRHPINMNVPAKSPAVQAAMDVMEIFVQRQAGGAK